MKAFTIPIGRIRSVEFGIAGDQENLNDSHTEVKFADTIREGLPFPGGLHDAHMGTTDNSWLCNTCGNRKEQCPGHNGHLKLRYPVQNPMFKDAIISWLRIICFECGELINQSDIKAVNNTLMKEYTKRTKKSTSSKSVSCGLCGAIHPKISRDPYDNMIIYKEYEGENANKNQMLNTEIAHIFEMVSENTVKKVGTSYHPRKLIINILLIPPTPIRPDRRQIRGTKNSTNDITTSLKSIIAINDKLPEIQPNSIINEEVRELATLLDTLVFDTYRGSPNTQRSMKTKIIIGRNMPIQSIAAKLPSKQGHIRGHILGKRVVFAGRNVISCDPSMPINWLGIPMSVARKIQIPIVVHEWNYDELLMYFNNRNKTYPGCNKIIKKVNGMTYGISKIKDDFRLEMGDVIFRDIIDGDVVAFNRNPTLLQSGITCHYIKVMHDPRGTTFSFNVSACKMYNADFDGDEMNMFFPQSVVTRNEISNMMAVGERMVSIQYSVPVVGLFQDSLIGAALFTMGVQKYTKKQAMDLFAGVPYEIISTLSFEKQTYTNYDILTMVMPKINFNATPTYYNPNLAHIIKYRPEDIKVVIENGVYKGGIMDKASVGQDTSGSIIHIIRNRYGSNRALTFAYTLQQILSNYCMMRGFGLGIDDTIISKETMSIIKQKTANILRESEIIVEQLNKGQIIPPIGMTTYDFHESMQINATETADAFFDVVIQGIDTDKNAMFLLAHTGTKGKKINLVQISSALGQQTLGGERIPTNFGYMRTLPYFPSYCTDAVSRGFVTSSYIEGLSIIAFIFNSMDARFSLIKKALATSIAGAQNRTSGKNLESAKVDNCRKVTKDQRIVQYIYGENGFDPRSLETVFVNTVLINNDEFAKYKTKITDVSPKYRNKNVEAALNAEFEQLTKDRNLYREIMLTIERDSGANLRIFGNKFKSPINMVRIINDVIIKYKGKGDLDPVAAIESINKCIFNLPRYAFNETVKSVPVYWQDSITLIGIYIRSYLNIATLIKDDFTNKMLDIVIYMIEQSYADALIDYGTAVGIIAAQSICEPMTQYVIDSHHRAGGASTKVDHLTRIAEVFGAKASEKMVNPSMLLRLPFELETNKLEVQKVASMIEMLNIERFISSDITVFYEHIGDVVHPDYINENAFIKAFIKNSPVPPPGDLINYCIRMEIDRRELVIKNMALNTLIETIHVKFPQLYAIYSPENAEVLILRLYLRNSVAKKSTDLLVSIEELIDKLKKTVIRGISGVISTEIVEHITTVIQDDGSISQRKVYAIETQGANVANAISIPYINKYEVHSNSLRDIAAIYGIEAARERIVSELKTLNEATITKGQAFAHFSIYADEMSSLGVLTSIQRNGVSKREHENIMLMLCTATPLQVLEEAALKGATDNIQGVSAMLMIGQTPNYGTRFNQIVLDEQFIKNNTSNVSTVLDEL